MKFSLVTISFFVSVLLATHVSRSSDICPRPVPAHYEHIKPGNVVAAYFASWDTYGKNKYEVTDIYPIAHKLTHIIYAFVKPNQETGECELADPWADVGANGEHRKKVGGSFGKLLELKKKFPHLKVLLSIGGGTYSKDISAIVQKGLLDTFVHSCVNILDRYVYEFEHSQTGEDKVYTFEYEGLFDGLDMDWEWLNNVVPEQDAQAFGDMIKKLRRLLDERSRKQRKKSMLTVALQVNASVYNALPLQQVTSFIDWYHVMAYNFSGAFSSGTGFNAPLCNPWSSYSVDNAISGLMNLGIAPNKLVLGIPLYGQVFDNTAPKLGSAFERTDVTKALSYYQIKNLYLDNGLCDYKWHDKSSVPYVYCPDERIFVSFDNERSLGHKVEYARNKRLKGIVLWKISGDDQNHSLIRSIK